MIFYFVKNAATLIYRWIVFNIYVVYSAKITTHTEKIMNKWQQQAKLILKTEVTKQGINYVALAERLKAIGIDEDNVTIAAKINRGKFSFAFFLQCIEVLNIHSVDFGSYQAN